MMKRSRSIPLPSLAEHRRRRGLTQRQLGELAGVAKKRFIRSLPVRTVRWEVRTTHHAPRRYPSRDQLLALATQHGKACRRWYGRSLGIIVYC